LKSISTKKCSIHKPISSTQPTNKISCNHHQKKYHNQKIIYYFYFSNMKIYLKWYYGYKNFWDELLLFGVLDWIIKKYSPEVVVIESRDRARLQTRIEKNNQYLPNNKNNINIVVDDTQNTKKSHLLNLLGFGKYKKYFKIFWWWEVLNTERRFPHNGRNLLFLYFHTIRQRRFVLLGWIGKDTSITTRYLYKFLFSRASFISVREKFSYNIVQKYTDNCNLYQDFSLTVLNSFKKNYNKIYHDKKLDRSYFVLLNFNSNSYITSNISKLDLFLSQHKSAKKMYFPCDIDDDLMCFPKLQKKYKDITLYDRTKHSLQKTLALFYNTKAGFGARLHFLYPLKVFDNQFSAIIYKEKVRKLIINK